MTTPIFHEMNATVRYRVYAIVPHADEPDQRWYIGCTMRLRIRLTNHWRSGMWTYPFDYVVLDQSETNHWVFDRTAMERAWIRRFDPTQIRNRNGRY